MCLCHVQWCCTIHQLLFVSSNGLIILDEVVQREGRLLHFLKTYRRRIILDGVNTIIEIFSAVSDVIQ